MSIPLKYQRPAIWWALFILIFCNMPMGPVTKSPLFFAGFDKLVHCGLFFLFTIFTGSGFIRQYGNRHFTLIAAIKVLGLAILYGGLIELLQTYVFTWRTGDWNDLLADTIGAGMGVFSILVVLYASANEKD